MHRPKLHGPRALALIAAFKFVKSALLVALAVGIFHLRHPDASERLATWLSTLPVATGHEFVDHAVHGLLGLNEHKIWLFSSVALAYATLYAIEGFGLWRNATWAKYLTVISTCLFIPIELWEIHRHFTPTKVAALAINIAIVAYLIWLLRHDLAALRKGRANPRT